MVNRLRAYIFAIFILSFIVAIASGPLEIEWPLYAQVFIIFLLFTTLYSHLKTIVKTGRVNVDYSISYSLSFGLFTGPLGIFLFELVNRFYIFLYRKRTDTADKDEFLHTFYNIGAPTLLHSLGFYMYYILIPYFEMIPVIGYWLLIIAIVYIIDTLSSFFLVGVFSIMGDIKTKKDAYDLITGRSMLESLQKAITNGLLFIFMVNHQWELMIALFLLNYIFSRSALTKAASMQHKKERDRFEQMAYTDYLTKIHNRAYMNKVMNDLNQSGENLGIIICDIDEFKRVNDTYNHSVGDSVITHFASEIKKSIDPDDYIFRSGGEEFTIILRNRTFLQCQSLVNNIQREIAQSEAKAEFRGNEISVTCTASFGLYYFKALETTDIKKAYVEADELLYRAKELGKNQVSSMNAHGQLSLSARI
ncbi:GGDEF domain-containing protein [Oceanobacillus sp. CAU 1775]